jgi:hypothetical protein
MKYLKLYEEFNNELSSNEINKILKGYLLCAIWTEEERLNDEYGSDFDTVFDKEDSSDDEMEKLVKISANLNHKPIQTFCEEDIEDNSLIKAYLDIKEFIKLAGIENINYAIEKEGLGGIGHDLWLTRNHHGAGFWDRGYSKECADKLTNAAHSLKEVDLFINDDMKLSFSNENV